MIVRIRMIVTTVNIAKKGGEKNNGIKGNMIESSQKKPLNGSEVPVIRRKWPNSSNNMKAKSSERISSSDLKGKPWKGVSSKPPEGRRTGPNPSQNMKGKPSSALLSKGIRASNPISGDSERGKQSKGMSGSIPEKPKNLSRKELLEQMKGLQREKMRLKFRGRTMASLKLAKKLRDERELADKRKKKKRLEESEWMVRQRAQDKAEEEFELRKKALREQGNKRTIYLEVFDGIRGDDMTIEDYETILGERAQAAFIKKLKRKKKSPAMRQNIMKFLRVTRVRGRLPTEHHKRSIQAIDNFEELSLLRECLFVSRLPELADIAYDMMCILKHDKDEQVTTFLKEKKPF
jgi:hypothetical protein